MKKSFKSILVLLLAISMILLLASCDANNNKSSEDEGTLPDMTLQNKAILYYAETATKSIYEAESAKTEEERGEKVDITVLPNGNTNLTILEYTIDVTSSDGTESATISDIFGSAEFDSNKSLVQLIITFKYSTKEDTTKEHTLILRNSEEYPILELDGIRYQYNGVDNLDKIRPITEEARTILNYGKQAVLNIKAKLDSGETVAEAEKHVLKDASEKIILINVTMQGSAIEVDGVAISEIFGSADFDAKGNLEQVSIMFTYNEVDYDILLVNDNRIVSVNGIEYNYGSL